MFVTAPTTWPRAAVSASRPRRRARIDGRTAISSSPTRSIPTRSGGLQVLEHPHRARRGVQDRPQGHGDARGREPPRRRAVRATCTPSASTCICACSRRPYSVSCAATARPSPSRPTSPWTFRRTARRLHRVAGSQAGRVQTSRALRERRGDRGAARRAARSIRRLPVQAEAMLSMALLRVVGGSLGSKGSWCVVRKPVLPLGIPPSRA
jgi:hypothetical protein